MAGDVAPDNPISDELFVFGRRGAGLGAYGLDNPAGAEFPGGAGGYGNLQELALGSIANLATLLPPKFVYVNGVDGEYTEDFKQTWEETQKTNNPTYTGVESDVIAAAGSSGDSPPLPDPRTDPGPRNPTEPGGPRDPVSLSFAASISSCSKGPGCCPNGSYLSPPGVPALGVPATRTHSSVMMSRL